MKSDCLTEVERRNISIFHGETWLGAVLIGWSIGHALSVGGIDHIAVVFGLAGIGSIYGRVNFCLGYVTAKREEIKKQEGEEDA